VPYTINDRGIFEFAYPTAGGDHLSAYHGEENVFRGLAGDDTLIGLDARDALFGGGGFDVLIGGRGRDKLWGGAGGDTFAYDRPNEGRDKIKDFVPGEDFVSLQAATFTRGADGLSFDVETLRLTYEKDNGKTVLIAKLNTPISIEHDVIWA
jgi:Ca2+-binding RTX toxin-like protein